MKKKINIIVGPTAGGKSLFGMRLAEKINGCILNADATQIYQDLKILSARPSLKEMSQIQHYLYGYLDSFTQNNVLDWLCLAAQKVNEVENPIFVGGTGFYIDALMNGISPIPEVDPDIRKKVRLMDIQEVHQLVQDCPFQDPQRQRRALEVQLSTGKPLSYFQKLPKIKKVDADFQVYFINPPRTQLYDACDNRFQQMIRLGAVDEVQHLLKINATGSVMKAIGVSQIVSYLHKECSFETMCMNAQTATRHYAKRQVTWFKHQIENKIMISHPEKFM